MTTTPPSKIKIKEDKIQEGALLKEVSDLTRYFHFHYFRALAERPVLLFDPVQEDREGAS